MSEILPNLVHCSTVTSNSQNLLYSLCKKQLPDDFTILCSVKWTVNHSLAGHQDTTADLIIISPQWDILILKVIEGDISYDQGNWYSNNHLIPDPFQQANETKYSFLQYLKEHDLSRDKPIVVGQAVAFPDISLDNTFDLNIPQTLILDQPRLFDLKNWIKSVMIYWKNPHRQVDFSQEYRKNILFSQQSCSVNNVLSKSTKNNSKQLIEFSQEQLEILEFLNYNHRVAINGCSGSGKSLIAIEQAHRLQQKGLNVLVISYKKSLTRYIQHRLGSKDNLHIDDFYRFSQTMINKAVNHNIDFKKYPNKQILFNEIIPTLLLKSIEKIDTKFDAIIVNDGQKLNELWWLALKQLLKNSEQGNFYFFYNKCQQKVDKYWHPPLQEAPYYLLNHNHNCHIIDDTRQGAGF